MPTRPGAESGLRKNPLAEVVTKKTCSFALTSWNSFANAVSNPPSGPSQAVFVARDNSSPGGGPTTFLNFYYTASDGCFFLGTAYIPNVAFQISASSASLNIDTSQLAPGTLSFYSTCPDQTPPSGVISVNWSPNGAQRTSGSTSYTQGDLTFRFVGTRLDEPSTISGTLFGTPLIDPFPLSYLSFSHDGQIIIVRN